MHSLALHLGSFWKEKREGTDKDIGRIDKREGGKKKSQRLTWSPLICGSDVLVAGQGGARERSGSREKKLAKKKAEVEADANK